MALGFDQVRGALGAVISVALLAMALFDPAVAWFAIPAALGGILVARALLWIHRSHHLERLEEATDPPQSMDLSRGINMATINPAGIGGIGLSVMAVYVALNFREGQMLLGVGLTGGVAIAAAMVRYRNTHRRTTEPLSNSLNR